MQTVESGTIIRDNYKTAAVLHRENRAKEYAKPKTKRSERSLDAVLAEIDRKFVDVTYENPEKELCALLEEGRKDVLEGRTYPIEDVMADIERRLADGTI